MGGVRQRRAFVILPDTNVLVYSFKRESPRHAEYRSWLEGVLNGSQDLALADQAVLGFVRIVTHPRIFKDPAPASEAMAFATMLMEAAGTSWLPPTKSTWAAFAEITSKDRQIRANLVPDAWLAAMAVSHGCRIATVDRGFGRFDRLEWFDPVGPT